MVKDFPYAGFNTDQPDEVPHDLRQRAGKLIEGARGGQNIIVYKLSGALAWLLYRAADLLDKARV